MKKTLAIFIFTFLLATPASAAIQQIRVLGVGVDASSVEAEAAAIDYAKKRAVYLVARKFQGDNIAAKVAQLKPEQYEKIIRGATVLQLKRDKETTYADITVSVVDTELKRALGMPVAPADVSDNAISAKRSVLVLPVFRTADKTYLWEADNPIKESIRSEVLRQSQGAVIIPGGDFEDLRLIDGVNAGTVTGAELTPMFERYGAEEIIIVIVALGAEKTSDPTQVTLRRLTREAATVEVMEVPAVGVDDSKEARISLAANAIAGALTQIATATSPDETRSRLQATRQFIEFNFANPRELGKMQEAVRRAQGVILLEIPAISLQNIRGAVYFTGEKEDLRTALAKKGIRVNNNEYGWALSLR